MRIGKQIHRIVQRGTTHMKLTGRHYLEQRLERKMSLDGIYGIKNSKTLLRLAQTFALQVLLKGCTHGFSHLISHTTRKVTSKDNVFIGKNKEKAINYCIKRRFRPFSTQLPCLQPLSHARKLHHRFFQNEVVNMSSMVKSSKRPMSMSRVLSHLAAVGRALQEKEGPKAPRAGPILPTLLTEML